MWKRLRRRLPVPDAPLALAALINFLHIWRLAATTGPCEWGPWYAQVPLWTAAPFRILVAAALLGTRRWWAEATAAIILARLVAANILYSFAPDYFAIERYAVPSVFETPAFEAVLAGVVLGVALRRILHRFGPDGGGMEVPERTSSRDDRPRVGISACAS